MNPEYLISRYLDGELTPQQDEELRQMLANDSTAREIYDAALNLSINAREDALSIQTPKDLFEETEDLIMMKIMSEAPAIIELYPKKNLYPRYITTIAAVLLLAFVSISDFQFGSYLVRNDRQSDSRSIIPGGEIKNQAIDGNVPESRSTAMAVTTRRNETISGESESSDLLATNSAENINSDITGPDGINLPAEEQTKESPANEVFLSEPAPALPVFYFDNNLNDDIFSTKPGYVNSPKNTSTGVNPFEEPKPKSGDEVELSTFLATSVIQNGSANLQNNVNTSISQSVAYALKSGNKIGVELGYSELTFAEEVTINVPTISMKKSTTIESTNFSSPSDYTTYSMNLEHTRAMVWGAAFYEQRLFKTAGLSLNGRLGLGGATDGPMGFARLFARYEVIPAVSLTFGADARMLYSTYSSVPDYAQGIMTSGSMVYGLQIRF
jgi:hypothetical protein